MSPVEDAEVLARNSSAIKSGATAPVVVPLRIDNPSKTAFNKLLALIEAVPRSEARSKSG